MKNIKQIVSKARKVAIYTSMTMQDFHTVCEVIYVDYDEHYAPLPEGQLREYPKTGYVRISEPVEVSFAAIDDDTVVRNAVEALNEEERRTLDELNKKLSDIRGRKNQLLALTHHTDAA